MFVMLFSLGIGLALIITICVILGTIIYTLASSAVIFSRIAFSLLLALAFHNSYPIIQDNGLLNYFFWAGIILGIILLLSLLPRVNLALKFFCTAIISYLAVEIVVSLVGSILCAVMGNQYEPSVLIEIVIKVVCTGISLYSLINEGAFSDGIGLNCSNVIAVNLERLLSAVIYGGAITFMCAISMNSLWSFPAIANWLIFGITTAATFAVDYFLLDLD